METQISRIKFPKTPYLDISPTKNDLIIPASQFIGKHIVITEKMDGENTTIYSDGYIHARSLTYTSHPSRDYIKAFAQSKRPPDGYRIIGENLYAKHSIEYNDLEGYFLMFGVFEDDTCLSWNVVKMFADTLDYKLVPVLYEGICYEDTFSNIILDFNKSEGYVCRLYDSFTDYSNSVGKFVRPNHVQSDEHWLDKPMVVNGRRSLLENGFF